MKRFQPHENAIDVCVRPKHNVEVKSMIRERIFQLFTNLNGKFK